MSKRLSSLMLGTAASARLRSIAASSRCTSTAVGTWSLSLPMRSKFCKVIFPSDQPYLAAGRHTAGKAVAVREFASEVFPCHGRWVDLARERGLHIGKSHGDI